MPFPAKFLFEALLQILLYTLATTTPARQHSSQHDCATALAPCNRSPQTYRKCHYQQSLKAHKQKKTNNNTCEEDTIYMYELSNYVHFPASAKKHKVIFTNFNLKVYLKYWVPLHLFICLFMLQVCALSQKNTASPKASNTKNLHESLFKNCYTNIQMYTMISASPAQSSAGAYSHWKPFFLFSHIALKRPSNFQQNTTAAW